MQPFCRILVFSFLNWQVLAWSLRVFWFLPFQVTKAVKSGNRSWPLLCRRHCGIGLMLISCSYLARQIYLQISHFRAICKGPTFCNRLCAIPPTSHTFFASPAFLCFFHKQLLSEWRSYYCGSFYSSPHCILFGRSMWVTDLFILLFRVTKHTKLEKVFPAELKHSS